MTTRISLAAVIGGAMLLAMTACSSPSDAPHPESLPIDDATEVTDLGASGTSAEHSHDEIGVGDIPPGTAGHIADGTREFVVLPGGDLPPVVVNVRFEGSEIWPKQVSVPAGRQVQLVLRNSDQEEHHYHILGMETVGILWSSKEDGALSSVSDEEHALHHAEVNMVPYHICNARSGICPTGEWVHAHADPADMDMIVFVANNPGSYEVSDPLHPDLSAVFTVF